MFVWKLSESPLGWLHDMYLISSDPSGVYTYAVFAIHHYAMQYIILIIILVYWLLYKIIEDYNSDFVQIWVRGFKKEKWNNYKLKIKSYYNVSLMYVNYMFLFYSCWLYGFFNDYLEDLTLGKLDREKLSYLLRIRYVSFFRWFFGLIFRFNKYVKKEAKASFIDYTGRHFMGCELFLFDKDFADSTIKEISEMDLTYISFEYLYMEKMVFETFYSKKITHYFTMHYFIWDIFFIIVLYLISLYANI